MSDRYEPERFLFRQTLKMVKTMNVIRFAGAVALALALAACGEGRKAEPANDTAVAGSQANEAAQVYSGAGAVQLVSGDKVTIAHGPIDGIGWPAMTMTFTAPSGVAQGVKAGSKVDFSFRQDGGSFVLTSLRLR